MKNLGKRIKSFVLICSLMVSMLAVTTSCGSAESTALTMGQWLTMVNDAFGMTSYSSVAPYFSTVKEDDPYFSAVQTAAEWDVIDPEKNPDLDVDAELTWRDALVTLVNVGKFVEEDATDRDKIDYAIDHFDSDIRDYWLDRVIKTTDAADLLTTAQQQWASATYDEENTVEEAKYSDEVKDYTSPDNFVSDYEISDDGTISMPEELAGDIEEGDVCVLPTTDGNGNSVTFRADTVTSKDGEVYITTSDEDLSIEDVYESLNIRETFVPDMDNVVIKDANGNILANKGEATASKNDVQQASTMAYQGDGKIHADPTAVKVSQEISVGGFTIGYDFNLDGALDFNASLTSDNLFGSDKKDGPELKAGITLGLSDVEVTNEIDYGVGGLNKAAVKVDYQSKIAEELTLSGEYKKSIPAFKGIGKSYLYELVSSSSYATYSADDTSTTMTIATITLYSAGIASVTLDVNLTISAEGKASVSVTEYGQKGIEYQNGNIRAIKNSNRVIDASIEGKAEATIGVGPALHIWGVSDAIIGFQVAAGVGAKASYTLHLADDQNHLIEATGAGLVASCSAVASLEGATTMATAAMITAAAAAAGAHYVPPTETVECHVDTCIEVQIYAIVNLEMTPGCLVDDLLKESVRLKWEICNDSNATLFGLHIDNLDLKKAWENRVSFLDGGQMPECTHDYTPWDDNAEEEDTEVDTENDQVIPEGDQILLSAYTVNGAEGEARSISVTTIPKGYKASDLVWSSENESVATVSSSGAIKLLSEGSTIITVRTSDKKYSVTCAVSVTAPIGEDFDPL